MAREIVAYALTGTTNLYAAVWNPYDVGKYWNTTTVAFQTYASANWSANQYRIPLTEYGPGLFAADFPASITAAGLYAFTVYAQGGANADPSDSIVSFGQVEWTGAARFTVAASVDGWSLVEAQRIILSGVASTDSGAGSSQAKYTALNNAATTRLLANITSGKRVVATVNGA